MSKDTYPVVRCRYCLAGTSQELLFIDTAVIPRVGELIHIENHTLPTAPEKSRPRMYVVTDVFHDIVRKDKYDDLGVIVCMRQCSVTASPWDVSDELAYRPLIVVRQTGRA